MPHVSHARASAVIPAYNEADRILSVLRVLEDHPLIDDIVVVSDGSTDGTAARARRSRATVIALPTNVGKGEAMHEGVRRAKRDVIAFFDADLVGLTASMIDRMLTPVLSGKLDMRTLIRDRQSETFQIHLPPLYAVGGERAVRRKLWDLVPPSDRKGFGIELALNHYAEQNGMRYDTLFVPGLRQIIKERKRGFLPGIWQRMKMTFECMTALMRLRAKMA